ncbi:hypothetical protein AT239_04140 [Bartonella henselae]|nr:hypothetical protein AT239_04140 [Bartonella henselae]OLL53447.1 hypothetical protein AT240_03170 [Bartonella henselae]
MKGMGCGVLAVCMARVHGKASRYVGECCERFVLVLGMGRGAVCWRVWEHAGLLLFCSYRFYSLKEPF